MSTLKFAETHNLVVFLSKPKESVGFEEIVDFLNASSVQYALTVNPTIYTACIEQFWTSAKVKTVNGERQIQALVDKKKVIISETSIRSDLKLDDAKGTDCLPTATIFAELERMGLHPGINLVALWHLLSYALPQTKNSTFPIFLDKQVEGMSKNKGVYVTPSHTKKVFANLKKPCISGRVTPLFSTIMVQTIEDIGANSATPTDSHSTPIITQPSSSKPQKKKSRRKRRKDSASTEPTTEEATPKKHVSTPSYDPPPSGEDRMQLAELMSLCTNLQEKVLDLENTKTAQAKEISSLKKRVKQLEKRRKPRTSGLRRLRKVGSSSRVKSSNDASLGAQEDASKQRRKIEDLDADAEEIHFEKVVEEPVVNIATTTKSIPISDAEVVTTASASVVIPDELSLAQTFDYVTKQQNPRPITTNSLQLKDKGKGKGKIVEPEVPLKKKDQVSLDEEMARNLEAQLQAELIEEERLARKKEEEASIALIES
ncbi:hypothetical protein Tco_0337306 [Tanacetum coccineum]